MEELKIAAVSDIHGDYRIIKELADSANCGKYRVLFVCGDLIQGGTEYELEIVLDRINKIKNVVIFVIAGNHDIDLQMKSYRNKIKKRYKNIKLLHDEYFLFNGIVIYGTPYSNIVGDWAFGCKDSDFGRHLPKKYCDILLTHNPPSDTKLSFCNTKDIGFKSLTNFLNDRVDIKYNFHGHCHECGGGICLYGKTESMNVSDGVKYLTIKL